ncbi:MAG: hypothetical protein ACD_39C01154G0002 [uncultured bacterium]|nr:MAG: hypothetical protein ACD_39C01154G0002 [uncultured bacterium]
MASNSFCRSNIPLLTLLFSLLSVTLLHMPLAEFPMGRDQGVWATAGAAINRGAIFFKDYLHFNLPGLGITYAMALRLTDDPRIATMLVSLMGSMLTIIGLYLLLQTTISEVAAAWSALLFSLMWPTYVDFQSIAQKDFMAVYGLLFGTWLMARSETPARWRKLSIYAGGVAVGISAMYKPLFAVAGILFAFIHAVKFTKSTILTRNYTKEHFQDLITNLLLLLAGLLTLAIILLLYLCINGGTTEFYNGLFVFAPAHSGFYRQSIGLQLLVLLVNSYIINPQFDWVWLLHFVIWTPIILTGLIGMVKNVGGYQRAWLSVPFITALFTYFVQGRCFSYHAIPWQICMFIIAGNWFAMIWARDNKSWFCKETKLALTLTLFSGVFWVIGLTQQHFVKAELPAWANLISREEYLSKHFADIIPDTGRPSPGASENLAEWIEQNSNPDDKILVWGLECQLYALSRRMYATHCPFDYLLTRDVSGSPRAMEWQKTIRSQFMAKLKLERPKFIIIVSNDANTVEPVPSNEAVAVVPGFQSFVANQYCKVKSLELFDVYQHNPGQS